MAASDHQILRGRDPLEVSQTAVRLCIERAEHAITTRGSFTLALSGGSTPRGLYNMLALSPYRDSLAWSKVHLFWGDERCVPSTHPDSNYKMVNEALITKVPIPAENINRIPAEVGNPQLAAHSYEQTLRNHPLLGGGPFPSFDVMLLGLGEDGHTASLFPGTDVLHEKIRWVAAPFIKRFSAHRITLTPPVINRAASIIFVVTGESKSAALRQVLESEYRPDLLPAQLIRPEQGSLYWLVDRPAAAQLTSFRDRS